MLDAFGLAVASVAKIDTAGGVGIEWTRYLMACIGILSLLGLGAIGLRKLVQGTAQGRAMRRSLKVIDVLTIGRKQRLVVVSCYDRTLVLGVGEKEVSLVAEVDGEPDAVPPVPAPARQAAPAGRFSELLARIGAELGPEATSAAADRVRARAGAGAGDVDAQRELVRRVAAAKGAGRRRQAAPQPAAALPQRRQTATVADALRDGGLLG
ncbi:flagellar biosynthetic protein FliO [Engelhardtia mirabilis]|uniref:Flagellar biosynthesis protein, FliO n=1 Tax=Engelhardtia mirabilis TaxID=2528011 RepID=A0A518BSS0_9BACT|nr:Flagellar biosynthesis protein, FliO [Planctomycetes bacterium Pla133]QDV04334.1 Flagellar biosynthesis protein, FliO [Planctomycetes bacterium Pla86]